MIFEFSDFNFRVEMIVQEMTKVDLFLIYP